MKFLILGFAMLLLGAVGLQMIAAHRKEAPLTRAPLAEIIPKRLADWEVSDLPLAETAEMKKAVGELLNYDEGVYRAYRRGARQFDVYVAYWDAGKMSERLVAGHSPDVCWVAAGWERVPDEARSAPRKMEPWAPKEGRYRVFNDTTGTPRWVVFWHISGGKAVNYDSTDGVPAWWTLFSDLAEHGLAQRRRQYFVRVSANISWSALSDDAGFREVMATLRRLLDAPVHVPPSLAVRPVASPK